MTEKVDAALDAVKDQAEAETANATTQAAATAVAAADAAAALARAQAATAELEAAEAIQEATEDMEWLKEQLTAQGQAIQALASGQAGLEASINQRQSEIKEMLESLKASMSPPEKPEGEPVNLDKAKKEKEEGPSEPKAPAEKKKNRILI